MAISAAGSSILARTSSSLASAIARRMDAVAAETSPLASCSNARPGSGRRPQVRGLAIAGLSRLEPAAQSVQLGQLVDRLPDGWLRWRSG